MKLRFKIPSEQSKVINLLSYFILAFIIIVPTFKIYQNSLSNDYPCCLIGPDSLTYLSYIDFISRGGEIDDSPKYMSHTEINTKNILPPLYFTIISLIINLTGFEPHQIVYAFAIILLMNSLILIFLLVRSYDSVVALLSLPFMFLMFVHPFSKILFLGQWFDNFGTLLLLSTLLIANFYINKGINSRSSVGLIIIITAMILSHTEWVYFLFIIILYYLLFFILKTEKPNIKTISKFLIIYLIAFIIALPSFVRLYYHPDSSSILTFNTVYNSSLLVPKIFYFNIIPLIILMIGLIYILYNIILKNNVNFFIIAFLSLFILSVSNFALGYARYYEVRWFWPLFLSPIFGIGLGAVLSKIKESFFKKFFLYSIPFIVLSILFVLFLRQSSLIGVNRDDWKAIEWIRDNTEENDSILFILPDRTDYYKYVSWLSHRPPYYKPLKDILGNDINNTNMSINKSVFSLSYGPVDHTTLLKHGFFKYELLKLDLKLKEFCSFDYVMVNNYIGTDFSVTLLNYYYTVNERNIYYNIDVFLNNTNLNLTYENGDAYVFKQNKRC